MTNADPAVPVRAVNATAAAQFAGVTLIWGSTWIVIHSQLALVPPAWSVAYRFMLAGGVLLAFCLLRRDLRAQLRAFTPSDHGFALIVALMQFSLNFNLVYAAQRHLTSGLVALLFALLLVPNAVLGAVFLGQRLTARFLLGSAVAIAGLTLLFGRDLLAARADGRAELLIGLALALLSVFSASIGNVMQATDRGRAMQVTPTLALAMSYGSLFNIAYAWVHAGPPQFVASPAYIAGLLYLGLIASVLAFSLYYRLLRNIGPAAAAYTSVLVPILAMALSTLFEGYVWSLAAAAGAVLAIAGMIVALGGRR